MPGTVFYWFKHYAAQVYAPDRVEAHKVKDWHCGVCFHAIQHLYYFVGGGIVNFDDDTDVELPPSIVSGSECIWLAEELRSLTNYLFQKGFVTRELKYTRGRIDAQCVFDSFASWPTDEIALPIQWFYFRPNFRRGMLTAMKCGGSPSQTISWWSNQKNSIPTTMSHIVSHGSRSNFGDSFWRGTDTDGKTFSDIDSDSQSAEPFRYVIVSRSAAMLMARPSIYLRRVV